MNTSYALIKNNKVENIIIGETGEAALQVLHMFYPELDEIVEVTEDNGPAWIGGDYLNGSFINIKPFESWIWDTSKKEWKPPVAIPDNQDKIFYWNESATEWAEFVE